MDAVFKGKASHAGAAPEKGNNTLISAASAVLNLHSIPRNSKGATRINVGKLVSGTERNIIPESAYMKIETRGKTSELNDYMRKYAERILHSAAEMHDTEVNIKYVGEAVSAESDHEMINMVKEAASKIYAYNLICDEKINFGASEDISYMMNKVQSNGGKAVYIMFGSDLKAEHHNSNFDFNEKDLKNAVKVYSILVFDILSEIYE
ncbi:M20/M25/M40 family metallo-hydrolase [Clostridium ganghwense]|uniref:M20/M25/M40 family metallo-hydrolase n=1 Tax=Clostridium ganghwense TaxID=312089 RepID=A0ABT4CNS8_9CLOT|nr:M20/M25/M40 family metallo-hydrolase [Clostridium ganghwense]